MQKKTPHMQNLFSVAFSFGITAYYGLR